MTSKKIKIIASLLILFCLFSTIIYVAYYAWSSLREGGYSSCLYSIVNEIDQNKSIIPIETNSKWKILSEQETDEILSKIKPYDCANTSNPSIDLWNNKIQIAARKSDEGTETIVWSKGSDGISHTQDDLIVPFGKNPPK